MNVFEPVPMIITDLMSNNAMNTPNKEAVIFKNQRITWEELNSRINRVANALIANGIKRGDKVSVYMSNTLQSIEIMFGIIKSGAVLVPLTTMIQPDTLLHMLQNSDAKMIFYSSDMNEKINAIKDQLPLNEDHFIEVGESLQYEQFLSDAPSSEPNVRLDFNDDCIILYSSGTTGIPKGILHTHYSRFAFATRLAILSSINRNSSSLLTTPLYTNSTWAIMLPTLVYGGTIIVMEKFNPNQFLEISEKEKPSHSLMVPTQYYTVLNDPALDQFDVTYEHLISVSSPLHKQTKLDIIKAFQCKFTELYGLTEGIGTLLTPEDVIRKPDSVGIPLFGTDIRIINENGEELPIGEVGEIVGRGSTFMKEYYKLPEKTREVMWFDESGRQYLKTGDMGKLDEEGFLYILGRKKDMIISGGLNIYPSDIENVIATHPEVLECAVIGVPHKKWGETPVAVVTLKNESGIGESELKQWINERVASYQKVSSVDIIKSFPRNSLGKILKNQLREERAFLFQ